MNNAEWLLKQGWKFSDIRLVVAIDGTLNVCHKEETIDTLSNANGSVTGARIMEWLDEEHYPILSDVEKEYLSSVIAPFRGQVIDISKCGKEEREIFEVNLSTNRNFPQNVKGPDYGLHWISIKVRSGINKNHGNTHSIELPAFVGFEHFVGMKAEQNYTLEELEL